MTASSHEVRCVAVPVTDFTGQVVGALGISGPIWRLSNQALHASAQVVHSRRRPLSAEFAQRRGTKGAHAKGLRRAQAAILPVTPATAFGIILQH